MKKNGTPSHPYISSVQKDRASFCHEVITCWLRRNINVNLRNSQRGDVRLINSASGQQFSNWSPSIHHSRNIGENGTREGLCNSLGVSHHCFSSEGVHSSASSLEGANATPGISGSSKRLSQSLIVPLNDLTRPLTYRDPDSYQSWEFSHHNWTIKQKLWTRVPLNNRTPAYQLTMEGVAIRISWRHAWTMSV